MEDFWPLQLNHVRDEGEIEHKKSGCTLMMAVVAS